MYLLPLFALVIGAVAFAIHLIETFDNHAHDAGIAHQAVEASLQAAENAPTPERAAQHVATAAAVQTAVAMPKAVQAQQAANAAAAQFPSAEVVTATHGWKEVLRQRALAAATVALTDATNDAIAASINLVQHPGDTLARAKLDGARQLQERARESIRKLGGGDSIDRMTPESSDRIGDLMTQNVEDAAAAFAKQTMRLAL